MSFPSPSSSSNTSPQSSDAGPSAYLPAPSVGSSARHGRGSTASSPYSTQQERTPEYVSPYPLLPSTTVPSAGRPITAITAITSMRSAQTTQSQPSSAVSSSTHHWYDDDGHEFTAPASSARGSQQPRSRTGDSRSITEAQKQAMIKALTEHRINTIGELRRVERVFASLGSSDVTQPMTAAWMYYVNSNSLLTELRGLTKQYPFSSECLEEAKRRVHQDPASNRSWNYCWLVLAKIHTDKLIPTYAKAQASRPEMWGGQIPLAKSVDQLAEAFEKEWNAALAQLLRYWESAPIR